MVMWWKRREEGGEERGEEGEEETLEMDALFWGPLSGDSRSSPVEFESWRLGSCN
jgi:hypothetical protein